MGGHVTLRRKHERRRSRPATVALVGRELPGDENLSLRYLAGALTTAGHRVVIVPLDGPDSLGGAAKQLRDAEPDVVGLSMPDADVTIDALALVRYVRGHGYAGHITCGGPLATLVRHELLDRHPGIDSVVRHDGELPITLLAGAVAEGRRWTDIPGISTREGDGPPAKVADPTALLTRPMHANPLPRLLGVGTARLSASRGCPGRCPYCGPAALQREAIREARRDGLAREEWRDAGVGKTRHRHATDLAEEVSELYHRQGARFFQVVDENLLSGGAERAESWLRTLMAELSRLGVGKTAWCLQADPATLTPPMIDLLEQLGVIRISVGIEGLTLTQLRALGRWGEATDHLALLGDLARRGIVTSFNSLIVHPESTVGDIARELDALAALPPVHFDVLSMAVYPGTQAHQSLAREGRVTGGMLALAFEPREIAVKRFRAALIRLRLQAIGRYGVNTLAHDVAINVALARRLGLPGYTPSLECTLVSALERLNHVRVRALSTALELARTELDEDTREQAMLALIFALRRELASPSEQLQSVQRALEGSRGGPLSPSNLMFASAMATGFLLCLSSATACGGKTSSPSMRRGDTDASSYVAGGTGGGAGAGGGAGGGGGAGAGAGAIAGGGGDPSCDASNRGALWGAVHSAGCEVCVDNVAYGIALDASGRVVDVLSKTGGPVPDDVRRCYLAALSGQSFPCLSGNELWYECVMTLR
jgi:anaerobic magnesium-protoporphyrin IX monomethyl ester cyclase